DVARFTASVNAREELVREHPRFKPEVRRAEETWLRRTADQATNQAELMRVKGDLQRAKGRLLELEGSLGRDEAYARVRSQVNDARRRLVVDELRAGEEQLRKHLAGGQYRAVAEVGKRFLAGVLPEAEAMGLGETAREAVKGLRQQALSARLEEGDRALRA